MTTYHEINALGLEECKQALLTGYTNYPSLAPEARNEFNLRMAAIRDRRNRLIATEKRIKATRTAR